MSDQKIFPQAYLAMENGDLTQVQDWKLSTNNKGKQVHTQRKTGAGVVKGKPETTVTFNFVIDDDGMERHDQATARENPRRHGADDQRHVYAVRAGRAARGRDEGLVHVHRPPRRHLTATGTLRRERPPRAPELWAVLLCGPGSCTARGMNNQNQPIPEKGDGIKHEDQNVNPQKTVTSPADPSNPVPGQRTTAIPDDSERKDQKIPDAIR
jgi:hypothetical protein